MLGIDPQILSHLGNYLADLAKEGGIAIILTPLYIEDGDRL
jgi:ABC-type multidrug transport system ATPase subunit